jgi:Xaa-Pro aminopeptidase
MSITADRLESLRAQLRKAKLTAWLAPRQDEFQGEYVPAYAERLRWLTGFAGSWGTAIVTLNEAAIFVDGRYTIQVKEQVDTRLITPQHLIDAPPAQWIEKHLKKGDRLGFDPLLTTIADATKLAEACKKVGAQFVAAKSNLIDSIWENQPPRPTAPIKVQPQQFAGMSAADKLAMISGSLQKSAADAVLLAETSSVSWVFNLRGGDVPYTPVVAAYAILRRKGKAELFIDASKVPEDVSDHLAGLCTVRKREDVEKSLADLARKGAVVLLDPTSAPEFAKRVLGKTKFITGTDPCTMPKAQKNTTEQEGARAAQRRDGAAMVKFLHWLEREAQSGTLTEWEIAEELRRFRAESELLMDLSFSTISAAGPNAAIPHYHVSETNSRGLNVGEIFLIDSGGQYEDGTTDITRTTVIGQPTDEMKDRFTRVLKGMIQISMLRFPKATTGAHIDALARAALWKAGFDYDHGTGHGVGAYLSVHEGPARIAKANHIALQPGMIMSNEPGYYKEGHFGIRIENLLLIKKEEPIEGGDRPMMGFETLTLCPIERKLIETRLLTRDELEWLDHYHARVWRELRPIIDGPAANWLTKACAPMR